MKKTELKKKNIMMKIIFSKKIWKIINQN